jgi:sugar phosphate isomerase/epimerase
MRSSGDGKNRISEWVHVNIPFAMLREDYWKAFLAAEMNPEIGLDGYALDSYAPADFQFIAERFRERNLSVTIHGPFMDLSAGSPDPRIRAVTRQRFEQMLPVIAMFGPRRVVCHAGYDDRRHHYFREQWLEQSLEIWSWLASRVKEEGSILVLENVYEQEPQEISVLLERLPHEEVGLCLDVGHQSVFSDCSLEAWLHSTSAYLRHLHLHDNRGGRDEHLPLGRGQVNFQELFRILVEMELGPLTTTMEPHREEDVRPSVEYLEKLWPW